ncbi:hypothetical protein [Streptomyces alkaliphilus]|uniref:hypothetical protein n=1 Tax=Streptomyces alkaliphilus TaxID=1472722 RepID=UPI00117DD63E|nr:hypothetical protein [Streptomyces alkaliphilus]MQS09038.1 hypothetical protein [Streptomyces alkaliphilus]
MADRAHRAVVLRVWKEHVRTDFPPRLRGAEPGGIDVVLLDASIAGCVSTWLDHRGPLDARRCEVLRESLAELEVALPLITDETERDYLLRLDELARLTLQDAPPLGS